MLVLARLTDQEIVIEDDGVPIIEIKVNEVRGNQARLGFKAAGKYKIYRKELYEKIKADRARAAEKAKTRPDQDRLSA